MIILHVHVDNKVIKREYILDMEDEIQNGCVLSFN